MSQDQVMIPKKVYAKLEELLADLHIVNYDIEIVSAMALGEHYLGLIRNARVKSKSNQKVYNFILKCGAQDEIWRSLIPCSEIFQREIFIYSKVLSEFEIFQLEKHILNPFKSYPKYYTSINENMNECVIMENMKELGYRLCNQTKTLNYEHILLTVKEYGRLHALSFAMRQEKPDLFNGLVKNLPEFYFRKVPHLFKDLIEKEYELALDCIESFKGQNIYNNFKKTLDNFNEVAVNALDAEYSTPYGVIRHGDCWSNNLLFKYELKENQEKPTKLCLIDWQLSHVGSPALDLSYLIFTSTDKALRDQHYDDIIREYYGSFELFLRELGCDPRRLFPFDVLQTHLKNYGVFGLYVFIICSHFLLNDAEVIGDVNQLSGEMNNDFPVQTNNDLLKIRMRDAILDCGRLGYF